MLSNAIKIRYDIKKYPFQKILCHYVYKIPKLEKLHLVWKKQMHKDLLTYNDNIKLRALMQNLRDDSPFYKLYHYWIAKEIAPHFGSKIRYSAHPKMRVHLAGTGSVSDFHRDAEITGRQEQINCYLPFTDVFDSSTLWCESDYGLEDYQPLNLKYGEALLWDGGYLNHGSIYNKSDSTRVSCDFRFHAKKAELVKEPWSKILSKRGDMEIS